MLSVLETLKTRHTHAMTPPDPGSTLGSIFAPRAGQSLAQTMRAATLEHFRLATQLLDSKVIQTPLLSFDSQDGRRVWLKAENLQPFGSFKLRAGSVVLRTLDPMQVQGGVATASAGNFAQGLALAARQLNIGLTVHVPDVAAGVKLDAIRALGARLVRHDFDRWWSIMSSRCTGASDGIFVHPVCEAGVILGNATIALELVEQCPQLDTVVVPVGGGGLIVGIALALRALGRSVRIVACEVETSTPLSAAFAAGKPVAAERRPSFVDGIGSTRVLDDMWPLLQDLIDDVIVVPLDAVRSALRALAMRNHLIVEGAGATALAAALSERCGGRNVVAVLSGGNIDPVVLSEILV
jgi:threonine dehydratase